MKNPLVISIVLVVVAIVFVGLFILGDYLNEKNKNISDDEEKQENKIDETQQEQENMTELEQIKQACIELGCEPESVYTGSVNSDKFYKCTCHYADRIHSENIICFKTKTEAESDERMFLEC